MQRILFVEDDPEIGQLISSWLGRHDMDVTLEPRGDMALARVEAEQPDLVLLDIMLPGQDGMSLCRDLRPRFDGPIVMLTSLDSDMNQILSLELGANDYILKTTPPPCCWPDFGCSFVSTSKHQPNRPPPAVLPSSCNLVGCGWMVRGEMCASMARALPSRPPTLICCGNSLVTRAKS